MNKKQMDYQNGYITQKYDRINVTLPKGKKEIYRKFAENKGLSLNAAINMLLQHWAEDQPEQQQPEEPAEKPTHGTMIETLDFISQTSIEALKEMGVYTLGEYVNRYYEDDPDEKLTVEEEDKLDDYLIKYHLW